MIGAGSVVFSRNLTGDILAFPEFKHATFSYMDVDADRLHVGAALCRKIGTALGATPTIAATTDRRAALDGADFVINMVQIGGFDSTLVDFEIPRKYGLNFTIADTTGPGGLFRALRTFPMLSGLCRDMEQVAPRAVLLNYSNPMGMNMQTVTRTSGVPAVGLCHSVQGTFDQLMRYLGEDPGQVAFTCAGINHMAFYQSITKDGVDLYPRLFETLADPAVYNTNKVRFELMRRLGYYVTESSEHNAEYSAHFIPHGPQQVERFAVPIDEYLRRCDGIVDEFERMKRFAASDEPSPTPKRSHEYGSTIVHSMATGTPAVVYGNMPNNGSISNLPRNAIVEVPTMVDRSGLRLTTIGELPPQLVGYMMPHVTQQELFVRAATEGRRDHVYQAAMADPLTAATLPPDKIVDLCDELIAAHGLAKDGGCLPDLDAKRTLVPTSGKTVPPRRRQAAAGQLGRRPGQGRRGPPHRLAGDRPVPRRRPVAGGGRDVARRFGRPHGPDPGRRPPGHVEAGHGRPGRLRQPPPDGRRRRARDGLRLRRGRRHPPPRDGPPRRLRRRFDRLAQRPPRPHPHRRPPVPPRRRRGPRPPGPRAEPPAGQGHADRRQLGLRPGRPAGHVVTDRPVAPYAVVAAITLAIAYVALPVVAGARATGDRRGPRVYPEPAHELLYEIGYALGGHDDTPRVRGRRAPPRPIFYGL